jgi:hypothetical protein
LGLAIGLPIVFFALELSWSFSHISDCPLYLPTTLSCTLISCYVLYYLCYALSVRLWTGARDIICQDNIIICQDNIITCQGDIIICQGDIISISLFARTISLLARAISFPYHYLPGRYHYLPGRYHYLPGQNHYLPGRYQFRIIICQDDIITCQGDIIICQDHIIICQDHIITYQDHIIFISLSISLKFQLYHLVRDVCHGHARYVARVVRLGEGTRQSHKGNAQALGRRSDGAANGSPTKMATAQPMAKPSAAPEKRSTICYNSVLMHQDSCTIHREVEVHTNVNISKY